MRTPLIHGAAYRFLPVSVGTSLVLVEVDISPIAVGVDQRRRYVPPRSHGQRDCVPRVPSSGADRRFRVKFLHTDILAGNAGDDFRPDLGMTVSPTCGSSTDTELGQKRPVIVRMRSELTGRLRSG